MSISQNFPNTRPSLSINFARSQTLDPRITFTRTTSGTRVGPDGYIEVIPADQPRFDFDPVTGECLGLLIEEGRTNLTQNSETLTDYSNQRVSNSTVTTGGPFGTGYHEKTITVVGDQYNFHSSNQISLTTGQTITFSIFFKNISIDPNEIYLRCWTGSGRAWTTQRQVRYNLSTLTATDSIGTIVNKSIQAFPDGWYRLSMTVTADQNGFAAESFLTDNNSIGTKYQIMGAQVEEGSFPTSYIPTSGSTVTRTADYASITGSNFTEWYNPSEGTIYTQFRCDNWNASNSFGKVFTIDEGIFGVENNGFWIGNDANTSNSVRYRVRESGTNQFGPANLIRNSNIVKSALSVKTSDFAATIDGNAPTTSTSGTLSTSMTNMTIGRDIVGIDNGFLNGHIQQLTYYPTKLSNQVLQNLTK